MSDNSEKILVNVHDLIEVLSTASDALEDERTSRVFEQTGVPSTWYDHYVVSEKRLQDIVTQWRNGNANS